MIATIFHPALRRFARRGGVVAALALASFGAASGPASAESATAQCERLVRSEVAWNRAGARQWGSDNVRALCRGSRDAFATIACFNKGVRRHDDWRRAINDCAGAAQTAQVRPAPPKPRNDGGFANARRIENRWIADTAIHVEYGAIEAGPAQPGWHSARWTIEKAPGTSFVRLRNMWKPDLYMNIEHGPLAAGRIEPGWWSAMWIIEPAPEGFVRIRNRWKQDVYLHMERRRLEAGRIEPGWWSAMWSLR